MITTLISEFIFKTPVVQVFFMTKYGKVGLKVLKISPRSAVLCPCHAHGSILVFMDTLWVSYCERSSILHLADIYRLYKTCFVYNSL